LFDIKESRKKVEEKIDQNLLNDTNIPTLKVTYINIKQILIFYGTKTNIKYTVYCIFILFL